MKFGERGLTEDVRTPTAFSINPTERKNKES